MGERPNLAQTRVSLMVPYITPAIGYSIVIIIGRVFPCDTCRLRAPLFGFAAATTATRRSEWFTIPAAAGSVCSFRRWLVALSRVMPHFSTAVTFHLGKIKFLFVAFRVGRKILLTIRLGGRCKLSPTIMTVELWLISEI